MTRTRKPTALVVDDDRKLSDVLVREVSRMGFDCSRAESGEEALKLVESHDVEVVLLDILLGDMDGIDVLKRFREKEVSAEVVILTGHGTVENAISAMKAGAFDFLTKPCKLTELEVILDKALAAHRVKQENAGFRQYLSSDSGQTILTRTPSMLRIIDSLDRIAQSDAPVLILGESGTGKELIAREIHHRGLHRDRPFVTVNCAVLQPAILESELFGHEKGSFTGAVKRRVGLFEIADGGAIFLDEIGEIDESIQAKLLRVLQFGEFRRVGSNETLSTNVRIIAATNRDLEKASRENLFRQDLFFRLNVVQIDLPPLRERLDDIEMITEHFLKVYGGKRSFHLTDPALAALRRCGWTGNIRELENVVRRLLIFHDSDTIDESAILAVLPSRSEDDEEPLTTLRDVEKRHIMRMLAHHGGNKKATAKALGISQKTLYNKLHSYGWTAGAEVGE